MALLVAVLICLFSIAESKSQLFLKPVRTGACVVTGPDIEGPYYIPGAPADNFTVCMLRPDEKRLTIKGRLTDPDCQKGLKGVLDIWQANNSGVYSVSPSYDCRRKIMTDPQGYFEFDTIMPGRYKISDPDGYRPAHVHFKIRAPGYNELTTQLYFQNDPYLAPHDACGIECHSWDRTLIVPLTGPADHNTAIWNIALRARSDPRSKAAERVGSIREYI